MQASDPVHVARALFEAYRSGDESALLPVLGPSLVGDATTEVEVTPHTFELIPPETVLVGGRLRVFRRGLRDSPAWWLMTFRDGLWVSATTHPSEAAARAALAVV
jgi:hypothetical protein